MGIGIFGRYFESPQPRGNFAAAYVLLLKAAVYGGAVIAVIGASAIIRKHK